jgi:hypothetical protein
MCNVCGRRYVFTGFGSNLKKRDHLENLGIDGKILLKWIISEWYRLAWAGFVWLRRGNSGM